MQGTSEEAIPVALVQTHAAHKVQTTLVTIPNLDGEKYAGRQLLSGSKNDGPDVGRAQPTWGPLVKERQPLTWDPMWASFEPIPGPMLHVTPSHCGLHWCRPT